MKEKNGYENGDRSFRPSNVTLSEREGWGEWDPRVSLRRQNRNPIDARRPLTLSTARQNPTTASQSWGETVPVLPPMTIASGAEGILEARDDVVDADFIARRRSEVVHKVLRKRK